MKLVRMLGLLCIALVMTFSSLHPGLSEVQLPPVRMVQKGYSLVPFNEQGWLIVERNAYQLALGKRCEHTDETMGIQAILLRLPAFKTHREFLRLMQERLVQDTDPQRFTILQ